jgi:hypothetical protein
MSHETEARAGLLVCAGIAGARGEAPFRIDERSAVRKRHALAEQPGSHRATRATSRRQRR